MDLHFGVNMKRAYILAATIFMIGTAAFAAQTAFDSMDKAVEVKLSPQIKTSSTAQKTTVTSTNTSSATSTIQNQKYTSALVNLDDAQVELRQELATVTAQYNEALLEKDKAIKNCKNLKQQIKAINTKMKNVDKSKKMINANLQTGK